MRRKALAVAVLAAIGIALGAPTGEARVSTAGLQVEIVPRHPAANSQYTVLVTGNTSELGWVYLYEARSRCPSRLPADHTIDVSEKTVRGSFSRRVGQMILVGAGPVHLCVYLQPAYIENGQTSVSLSEPPVARAEVVVLKSWRLPGRTPVVGNTPGWIYSLALATNASGTRFASLMIACGRGPAGEGWSTKRFNAKISLPITKRLRWSGAVQPDNGRHYEPPYPPDWTRPVHASFDLQLAIDDQGGLVRGTARLSGPGLPCPVVHHITPAR